MSDPGFECFENIFVQKYFSIEKYLKKKTSS